MRTRSSVRVGSVPGATAVCQVPSAIMRRFNLNMNRFRTAAFFLVICFSLMPTPGAASIINVDAPTGDFINGDGLCSLSEAIESANTNSAVDDCNAGNATTDTIQLLNDVTLDAVVDNTVGQTGTIPVTSEILIEGFGRDHQA